MLSFLQYSSRAGLYSYLKTGFFHQNLMALIQIGEREKQQQQWKLQVTWDRTAEWARVPWTAYQDHLALLVCKTQPEGNGWASWSSDQSWYVFESERKINGFKVTTEIPTSEKVKAKQVQGQDKSTRYKRIQEYKITQKQTKKNDFCNYKHSPCFHIWPTSPGVPECWQLTPCSTSSNQSEQCSICSQSL